MKYTNFDKWSNLSKDDSIYKAPPVIGEVFTIQAGAVFYFPERVASQVVGFMFRRHHLFVEIIFSHLYFCHVVATLNGAVPMARRTLFELQMLQTGSPPVGGAKVGATKWNAPPEPVISS